MTPLALELTRLIGKKELTFGCIIKRPLERPDDEMYFVSAFADNMYLMRRDYRGDFAPFDVDRHCKFEIIGHPATLSDFHRWMNEKKMNFDQTRSTIGNWIDNSNFSIPYDSSKDLLDQEEETLKQIISLIKSHLG